MLSQPFYYLSLFLLLVVICASTSFITHILSSAKERRRWLLACSNAEGYGEFSLEGNTYGVMKLGSTPIEPEADETRWPLNVEDDLCGVPDSMRGAGIIDTGKPGVVRVEERSGKPDCHPLCHITTPVADSPGFFNKADHAMRRAAHDIRIADMLLPEGEHLQQEAAPSPLPPAENSNHPCAIGCYGDDHESHCAMTNSPYCGRTNPEMVMGSSDRLLAAVASINKLREPLPGLYEDGRMGSFAIDGQRPLTAADVNRITAKAMKRHCAHRGTKAVDPEANGGATVLCVDCGMGRRGGVWHVMAAIDPGWFSYEPLR